MKIYEMMAENENLSWCKPIEYINDNKRAIVVCNENKITAAALWDAEIKATPESCHQLTDGYYNIDLEMAEIIIANWFGVDVEKLESQELGCQYCPWRNECEAMEPED